MSPPGVLSKEVGQSMSGQTAATTQDFAAGTILFKENDPGRHLYVVRSGKVKIYRDLGESEMVLAFIGPGEFFGEMVIFDRAPRSATVRARGDVRLLTIDKATFLRRITEDPSLAFRIVKKMSQRVRELNAEVATLKGGTSDV